MAAYSARKKAKEKLFLDFQDGDGANSPSSDVVSSQKNVPTEHDYVDEGGDV